jgi:hypothetical protein
MKKLVILLALVLILAFLASPANTVKNIDLSEILEGCTVGVNHANITTHDGPVLWKVLDVPQSSFTTLPDNVCMIVKYYSKEAWETNFNFIAIVYGGENIEEHKYLAMGLNEKGLGGGHSWVLSPQKGADFSNRTFLYHALGNYQNLGEIRDYLSEGIGQNMYNISSNFPYIDSEGNASMFEVDAGLDTFWEYNTMDSDREEQGLFGFVVRANEFHRQDDGTDNTSIQGRYLAGTENTLGLINAGELNEQTVVQTDSNEEYRLLRYSAKPFAISNQSSWAAHAIRGATPGEDPALATMWVLLGNPSFSIAVPTWVAVFDIPEPISTCAMHMAVTDLYDDKRLQEKGVQTAVLPAESHLFEMVNKRLLPYWRTLDGPPSVDDMTRVEYQMALDAYSVVDYMATTGVVNYAPTVDFEVQAVSGFQYEFIANAFDKENSELSYLWNFGDGNTSDEIVPLHEYPGNGIYLVSVTVADDDKVTTTAWRYLTVE